MCTAKMNTAPHNRHTAALTCTPRDATLPVATQAEHLLVFQLVEIGAAAQKRAQVAVRQAWVREGEEGVGV